MDTIPTSSVSTHNPMGTDGFEFVEYTAPDTKALGRVFEQLGFTAVARHRSKAVTVYRQGNINFIVNAEPKSRAQLFAQNHGPSACAMAFRVANAAYAHRRALDLGAADVPTTAGPMELNIPAIEGIGGSIIYLVDRYKGLTIYDIDFEPVPGVSQTPAGAGLVDIDHLTHNVYQGRMNHWAEFYERLFNMREIRYFDIEGKHTGLKSRALTAPCGKIRIPINESSDDKSQIEEYLRTYRGEGIQHIALTSENIFATFDTLKARGVPFLTPPPDSYYDMLAQRLPGHGESVVEMKKRGLLLDGTTSGGNRLLLQIFTETVIGPIFFEIIQRKGDEGFGEGNFKALFESMERDQIRRGVLKDPGGVKRFIPLSHREGKSSRQAHADLPEGTFEREVSKEGFSGPATFFHHQHPPTGWTSFEGPLRPHAYDLTRLNEFASSPWDAAEVLKNTHASVRFWRTDGAMDHLARNGDGDDLLFIHDGAGELFCDYGHLTFAAGDYIMMPRGTMWRLECSAPTSVLMVESTNGSYALPDRGPLGPTAVFDPAVLDVPSIDDAFRKQQADGGRWAVKIKKRGAVSTATYGFNPLDAVGWHGDLMPVRLNVKDIRPVLSDRYHLPPSAHTTFVADRLIIGTFAPRPFETDPGALKVPFFHNNDDYDEVLFYHAGNFFSRDNIHAGMMTFHPGGFTHGPHPKALKNMLTQTKRATDEYAVMIETRDPLEAGKAAAAVEFHGYVDSWKSNGDAR